MDQPLNDISGLADSHEDLACPLCGYCLRGLAEPRCPECGYRFTWAELIAAHQTEHPFAFDAAAKRSYGNLVKTFFAAFLPSRLWGTLAPGHTVRIGRLLLYLLLMWLPIMAASLFSLAQDLPSLLSDYHATGLSFWWLLFLPYRNRFWATLRAIAPILAIFPALLVFQYSMRSRKIRWYHVLRCVTYASGVLPFIFFVPALLAVLIRTFAFSFDCPLFLVPLVAYCLRNGDATAPSVPWMVPVVVLLMGWPLWNAYRRYFRFDHAFATILSVQVIVLLIWAIIEVQLFG